MTGATFKRRHLHAPLYAQILSFAWFVLFASVGVLVLLADRGLVSPSVSRLLRGNPDALAPKLFGALLIVTGAGTWARGRLAGVVVDDDRITARTSNALGLPRVHTAYFAELRGAVLDGARVVLVQFDGSYFELPATADDEGLRAAVVERLACFHVPIVDPEGDDR